MRLIPFMALLMLQVACFAYAKVSPWRYFCWAPYDMHTRYRIEVALDGEALSPEAVRARYRLRASGWNARSWFEIVGAVDRYERSYGREDNAEIRIVYQVNGGEERVWTHPE